MKQQIRSKQFLQRRKFLIILPLLVLPFITLIFWALGGGKAASSQSLSEPKKELNMELPDALLDHNKDLDKMSYYHLAKMDSNKRKKQMQNDPYYQEDRASDSLSIKIGN